MKLINSDEERFVNDLCVHVPVSVCLGDMEIKYFEVTITLEEPKIQFETREVESGKADNQEPRS